MEWGLIVIEELINFIGPPRRIITIKKGKLEPEWASLKQAVPLVRIMMVIIKLYTAVILVMPTKITQEPEVVSVMTRLNASLTAIVAAEKTRRRKMAWFSQRWAFRWWSSLISYQCTE
jgi:hypothetical protein